jgi:hypothetical protein
VKPEFSSIYHQALGEDFYKLHPQIQKRFGFSSCDKIAAIGRGHMEKVWHGAFYTLPFLRFGAWRRIMFPEQGRDIPFSIENYAYRDRYGRETVTWIRRFATLRHRRFDAYMIWSDKRNCIVDYLGTHQHLAVDLHLSVAPNGGLLLRSGAQRFYEPSLRFDFPLLFSGIAEVCEWFDDDAQKFRIEVNVTNGVWGPLFGYSGAFDVQWIEVPDGKVPRHIKPRRQQRRE